MGARVDGDRMIIDTAGFIHWPHDRIRGAMVSASQVAEIERHAPEVYLLLEQLDVEIAMPSEESLQLIAVIAAETGDLGGLSPVDLEVLALGLDYNREIATDDHRVQNVAEANNMAWRSVSGSGIRTKWRWKLRCLGCRREWQDSELEDGEICSDCGSRVRLVRS